MRRPAAVVSLLATLLALAASGCGGPSSDTPAACLEGSQAYLRALGAFPGEVRLRGGVPISDCLAQNQQAGDLATVGGAMVAATTRLNGEARAEPGGQANEELGYLLGAVERGASDETNGVHAELVRRLLAAARYSPDNRPLPPAFYRAYQSGYAAGRQNG
jgi:hypothetical protein